MLKRTLYKAPLSACSGYSAANSVVTDGGTLNISGQPYSVEAMGETLYNVYTDVLYVKFIDMLLIYT